MGHMTAYRGRILNDPHFGGSETQEIAMRLVTNSVQPTQVRETDDAYIIEDVPFIRPMELAGGYVPRANIKETAKGWHGVPATLNHPRNTKGEPIPAHRKPETHIGEVRNPEFDGETVTAGEIRVNKSDLQSADAAKVKQALENDDPVEVSSQYVPQDLPAGEYDGEHRANVEKIVRPDSVALLPNKTGQCSIEDGCGINPEMVANADVTLTANATHSEFSEGDVVTWDSSGGTAHGVIRLLRGPDSNKAFNDEIDGDVEVEPPAALIEVGEKMEDRLEPTGTMVAHKTNTDTLSLVDGVSVVSNANDPQGEDIDMRVNQRESVRDPSYDEPEDADWSEVSKTFENFRDGFYEHSGTDRPDDAPGDVSDAPSEMVEWIASKTLLGESDADSVDSLLVLPVVNPSTNNLNRNALIAVKGGRGAQAVKGISDSTEQNAIEKADSLLESEFDMDVSGNSLIQSIKNAASALGLVSNVADGGGTPPVDADADTMDRDDKIEYIVSNSALSEDSLQERCNDGVDAIYDDVEANSDTNNGSETMGDNENNDGGGDPTSNGGEQVVELTESELDDLIEEKAQEIVANQQEQSQKEELATEIVANSAEYEDEDAVLEDYPTEAALETKRDSLQTGADLPTGSPTANLEGDDYDLDSPLLGGD